MNKRIIKKTLILSMLILGLCSTINVSKTQKLDAAFRVRSSRRSFGGGGFKSFKSSSPSKKSSFGTFRNRTQKRNATINRTQNSVNNRSSRNSRNSSSRSSMFGRNPFLGGIAGGFIGGSISRMLFGGRGYNSGGGYYQSGGGMFTSSIINILFIVGAIWLIMKLFKKRNNNYSGGYNQQGYGGSNYQNEDIYDNNQDFDNQKLDLTKDDAKNYINDMNNLLSSDKLSYINKIDLMTSEEEIINYVENIEKSNDENNFENEVSLDDAKNQGNEYVTKHMDWISEEQKQDLLNKIKKSNSIEEIENVIAPLDRD